MNTEEETSLTVEQCTNNDDKDFCSVYYGAIKRLLDIDNRANLSYLYRYFKIYNEYYDFWGQVRPKVGDPDDTIINLLKDSLYYRIAFIYRNAPLISSAVSFHFRNIYEISPMTIEKILKKKVVKICSLGGCAASDIIAIIKVLESIALKNGIKLDFRVTIIESDERWKITCLTVLRCLEQFREATWKISFIHANVAKKSLWNPETSKAVQEADIISMIRFFSKFNFKEKIMKEICDKLQPGAVLFVLDHPLKELIELSFDVTNSDDIEVIHSELNDFHSINIEVLKHFKTLYQKHFGKEKQFKINLYFNVFISAWAKVFPKTAIKRQASIEYLFRNNLEKYKPKQNFLSTEAFRRFEKCFTIEKEAAGWKPKGIRRIVQEEKEKRNNLLAEFMDEKKNMDTLQKNLLKNFQTLKEEGKKSIVLDEESLDIYLIQKRRYSMAKYAVYTSSFMFY